MRIRLDQLLVERGLFSSREQSKRAVMAGEIWVDGERRDKPGAAVAADAGIEVRGRSEPYVSRGGRKLEQALRSFGVDPEGATCLDVGASTGGFTDCLLQHGAVRVYAVDVGYGQLDARLRGDARVVVMERINARYLPADALPERCRIATMDVSFISVVKVAPALLPHLASGADLVVLVKPQFEAGRGQVGKGGVVRDDAVRRRIAEQRIGELSALGLRFVASVDCDLRGPAGNREILAHFRTQPSRPS